MPLHKQKVYLARENPRALAEEEVNRASVVKVSHGESYAQGSDCELICKVENRIRKPISLAYARESACLRACT
jgi:hypothetical protein